VLVIDSASPLIRIASDDADPVIGRAFALPVGIAEGDPTSPRKGRGGVKFGKLTHYTPSDNNSRIFRTRRGAARGPSP
jgi:hypothetical protein